MNWLKKLLGAYSSHLIGAMGVLAVCGIGATILAGIHISAQRQTIAAQTKTITAKDKTIDQLGAAVNAQIALRDLEQQNTLALQETITQIEAQSSAMQTQIQELEATNAQVRDFMARPIPDDLRRLLDQQ